MQFSSSNSKIILALVAVSLPTLAFCLDPHGQQVPNSTIEAQNSALLASTEGKGFGPQSPRDIGAKNGSNIRAFTFAPHYQSMNLCNIHFHAGAEHKGGEFAKYLGNGDGKGYGTGFAYSGKLSEAESKPLGKPVCQGEHGSLNAGDTIEVHYVHSSAQVVPGPTLGACLMENTVNPQLRVEAQVFVLVNDPKAADFSKLVEVGTRSGYQQALNIPKTTGASIQYAGSTTGPAYNEKGSPLQVTWSVRPKVLKVSAESVGKWCEGNIFKEDHAHGVRNLVVSPSLLSSIK